MTEVDFISQMMKCTWRLMQNAELFHNYHEENQKQRSNTRLSVIKWIIQVAKAAPLLPECRDTAVQIFDQYMAIKVAHDAKFLENLPYLSVIAACSLLLSVKINHSKSNFSEGNFPDICHEDFVAAEADILLTINFVIVPQATPTFFVSKLLDLWDYDLHKPLLKAIAEELLTILIRDSVVLLYAPSTIAISALVLSFMHAGLDCSDWMNRIPAECLPTQALQPCGGLTSRQMSQLCDLSGCIERFRNAIITHCAPLSLPEAAGTEGVGTDEKRSPPSLSPTSICAVGEDDFVTAEHYPHKPVQPQICGAEIDVGNSHNDSGSEQKGRPNGSFLEHGNCGTYCSQQPDSSFMCIDQVARVQP